MRLLACNEPLQKEITQKKMVEQACDLWNNAKNGFIEGAIVYRPAPSGYSIEIRVQQGGNCCGGMRVHIIKEESAQKNTFSCVAIEPY
jgi:hypothetical protein